MNIKIGDKQFIKKECDKKRRFHNPLHKEKEGLPGADVSPLTAVAASQVTWTEFLLCWLTTKRAFEAAATRRCPRNMEDEEDADCTEAGVEECTESPFGRLNAAATPCGCTPTCKPNAIAM